MDQRTCAHCGADIAYTHANQRYCSPSCRDAKKWAMRPRVPCVICGGLTGYVPSNSPAAPRCKPCTRGPNYRPSNMAARGYVDSWTCAECGLACERPATKGQRPKYCETCRRVRRNPLIRMPHAERLAIYARDGWTCWLCGDSVDAELIGSHSEWRPSLDHVITRSSGGGDEPSNLRLAHWWCNIVRSDERAYTPEDFRAAV